MSLIHLSTELRQELKLTPQLLQSMELLQMNSQELLDYLNQVSEENPLVEQTDLSSLHKAYEALRQKVHWINGGLPEDGHGAMPDRGAADRETESLSAFLCDQLERRRLPKPLLALTRYLAELVDEEGRLSQEDLDGVADLKIPQALTQQALETLQSLDPAGVGARSLSECLLLQLARQDAPSPLDMEIVRRFLPDLGKKHYSLIARELHTTPEEVRAAEKRQLSSPGKGIIFTMPLSSVSGVVSKILNRSAAREDWGREQEGTSMAEKGKNDLVVVVVNHGCTDLVMEAAQAAGARGGTVLHARRLGYEEGERSGEGSVRPEKEIVTILVPRSIRQMVMERVSKTAGINTQARGILFSLPVDEIAGLALAEPQAEV